MELPEEIVTPEDVKLLASATEKLRKISTVEALQAGLNFLPRSSDVFISTLPKAGTTWVSQICHQLRTGGDMAFKEITEVVPYLEMAKDLGMNCNDEQRANPRLFKTHLWENSCPKGAKYIVVVRHPYDTAISEFTFMEGWMFEVGSLKLNHYIQENWPRQSTPQDPKEEKSSPLNHCMSWWPRRHDKDVLLVFYEDLKEDLVGEVQRIADFIGVSAPERVASAVEMSTFTYMFEHRGQFDDSLVRNFTKQFFDFSSGAVRGKIVSGGGKRELLNDRSRLLIDRQWDEVCLPVTGAKNYDEWRQMWRSERSSRS